MDISFEEVIRDDPVIQQLLAQSKAKGEREAKARIKWEGEIDVLLTKWEGEIDVLCAEIEARAELEGEIEGLRKCILNFLGFRFSSKLAVKAVPIVYNIKTYETLDFLFKRVIRVQDEDAVRIVLGFPDLPDWPNAPDE